MENYIATGEVKRSPSSTTTSRSRRRSTPASTARAGTRSPPTGSTASSAIDQAVNEQVDKGTIEDSNSEIPKPSLIGSILATLLPFALIILLFLS